MDWLERLKELNPDIIHNKMKNVKTLKKTFTRSKSMVEKINRLKIKNIGHDTISSALESIKEEIDL